MKLAAKQSANPVNLACVSAALQLGWHDCRGPYNPLSGLMLWNLRRWLCVQYTPSSNDNPGGVASTMAAALVYSEPPYPPT
ncbi:hypothetical protein LY76DRAFT_590035 [Colletotrichum caudatum]|nr:hypothetical protein LY76DRAFT_590035 [Colletotrichum caudatum]